MDKFLETASGLKISIHHLKNEKERVVIVAPGFFQSKLTATFKKLANDILAGGFDVISMDFRGHGKSEGLYTFSALEKEDLKAVLDYAKDHYKKIGVLGFSYGGSIAIIEQAEFRNIDSIACVGSPMASDEIEFKWWTLNAIKLGIKGLEPGAGVRPGNPRLQKIKPIDVISSIAPTPILLIHGAEDPTVGVRHSRELYQNAKEPKELRIFEKASHAEDIYRDYPNEFMDLVKQWFEKTLKLSRGD